MKGGRSPAGDSPFISIVDDWQHLNPNVLDLISINTLDAGKSESVPTSPLDMTEISSLEVSTSFWWTLQECV
jgi:hypothetical protein